MDAWQRMRIFPVALSGYREHDDAFHVEANLVIEFDGTGNGA
jgi:hypothetical protein